LHAFAGEFPNRQDYPASAKIEDRFDEMAKGTFGERLKRERELREVSIDEICSATRIAPKFLVSRIERGKSALRI
jgi:hypothetical protein